jgi:hypothetical protein
LSGTENSEIVTEVLVRLLVLYYSRTGNNRLFATHIARRLNSEIEEVRRQSSLGLITFLLDMIRDRRPKILPLTHKIDDYDHVLLVAPIWDMNIAHPMKSALEVLRGHAVDYSFATLCGTDRQGQTEQIRAELLTMTGREPSHQAELHSDQLMPKGSHNVVRDVTQRRLTPGDLAFFSAQIDQICAWFT